MNQNHKIINLVNDQYCKYFQSVTGDIDLQVKPYFQEIVTIKTPANKANPSGINLFYQVLTDQESVYTTATVPPSTNGQESGKYEPIPNQQSISQEVLTSQDNKNIELLLKQRLSDFRYEARHSTIEYGEISPLDKLIEKWSRHNNFPTIAMHILKNEKNNHTNKAMLIKALRVVNLNNKGETYRMQISFAVLGELSNQDEGIQEAALHCFESWDYPDSIDYLEDKRLTPQWIDEYRKEVIDYLKSI